ncbi:MAG: hypothetical protein HY897_18030 [Deltaproteobacteria bacterium]|nr:hypothetical protein [Deltaproteobacteria bacterium]
MEGNITGRGAAAAAICCCGIFCALATGCSSPSAFTAGNLVEPHSVAAAAPSAGTDPLAHTFVYVSDTAKDNVKVVDVSLRVFQEAPIPYFPLVIPVGSRPTRMAVSGDQQRVYVINSASRDLSVIDTALNAEAGAEVWNGTGFANLDPQTGLPRRIYTGLVMTDLAAAFSRSAGATRLHVAADTGDNRGRLVVVDTARYLPGGVANPALHSVIWEADLPGVPGRIDVSGDGDTVFLSNRSGKAVAVVDTASKSVTEIDLGYPTELVKAVPESAGAGRILLASSKSASGVWVVDLDTLTPRKFGLSAARPLGEMLPVVSGVPHAMALSPATSLGGTLAADPAAGCPGTVALVSMVNGGVSALDVSGCARHTYASGVQFLGRDAGLEGLFVEAETTAPTISVPELSVGGRTLTQSEQFFATYPRIEGWDRSDRNYGVAISRLLRQFVNRSAGFVTFEGVVVSGASGAAADPSTFSEAGRDFVAAGVEAGSDWLVILGPDGAPRTACDDGSAILASEFQVTAVEKTLLTVAGPMPPATCVSGAVPWQVRPKGLWTVFIEGLGILGRAAPGTQFVFPPAFETDKPHLALTVQDGTQPSVRDMTFAFGITFNAFSLFPPEASFMPTDIGVAEDSINPGREWAFIVYSGASALFQFSPQTLDTTTEVIYR